MTETDEATTRVAAVQMEGSEEELKNVAGEYERLLFAYFKNRQPL